MEQTTTFEQSLEILKLGISFPSSKYIWRNEWEKFGDKVWHLREREKYGEDWEGIQVPAYTISELFNALKTFIEL